MVGSTAGAALLTGCGSNASLNDKTPSGATIADAAFNGRIVIPPAPPDAEIETFTDDTNGFTIQFSLAECQPFVPPEYVTVLNNRVFELVNRTLPAGDIFRPNVGLIVDNRFQGQPIDVNSYVTAGQSLLGEFFQNFQVISQSAPFTINGHQAVTLEYTATWQAPDGTLVDFHRITLFAENRGNVLNFTFTAPPDVFEANRAAFESMLNSITLF